MCTNIRTFGELWQSGSTSDQKFSISFRLSHKITFTVHRVCVKKKIAAKFVIKLMCILIFKEL